MTEPFPGLTDIHAHPAMNAFLWGRDLRRHYFTGKGFNPLASLTDFKLIEQGGVRVLWSSPHIPEPPVLRVQAHPARRPLHRRRPELLKKNAWECRSSCTTRWSGRSRAPKTASTWPTPTPSSTGVIASGKTAIVHTRRGRPRPRRGPRQGRPAGAPGAARPARRHGRRLAHDRPSLPERPRGPRGGHPRGEAQGFPTCPLDTEVDLERGLTPIGEAVVERMVELRMIPDVTHCTPPARSGSTSSSRTGSRSSRRTSACSR